MHYITWFMFMFLRIAKSIIVPQPNASWIFDEDHGGEDISLQGTRDISLSQVAYGPGLLDKPNGAVVLPTDSTQRMTVYSGYSLRFDYQVSFITHVYVSGNTGRIIECKQQGAERMSISISPDSTSLHINIQYRYGIFDIGYRNRNHYATNVLSDTGWHKIGMSIRRSDFRLYVNGSLVFTGDGDSPHEFLNRGYTIYFGTSSSYTAHLGARMACAKFYNSILSASQMSSINCKNIACTEVSNGRCVGSCLGSNIGDLCDTYIFELQVFKAAVSTKVFLDTGNVEVSWNLYKAPRPGTRNFYQFSVIYKSKATGNSQYSPLFYIGNEDVLNNTYVYTIDDIAMDVEYDISIRSERVVGDYADQIDSSPLSVKSCAYPKIPNCLSVYMESDTFVTNWTNNLEHLDSGCSSKTVFVYYKYTAQDIWVVNVVDLTANNYIFATRGHNDCTVKMVVVNNVGLDASTEEITFGNGTISIDDEACYTTDIPSNGVSTTQMERSVHAQTITDSVPTTHINATGHSNSDIVTSTYSSSPHQQGADYMTPMKSTLRTQNGGSEAVTQTFSISTHHSSGGFITLTETNASAQPESNSMSPSGGDSPSTPDNYYEPGDSNSINQPDDDNKNQVEKEKNEYQNDDSMNQTPRTPERPNTSSKSTITTQEMAVNTDKPADRSNMTLILPVCLTLVGAMLAAIIITGVCCWRRNKKKLKAKDTEIQTLKRKSGYSSYLEPVLGGLYQDMYDGHRSERQYEPLDIEYQELFDISSKIQSRSKNSLC